VAQPLREADRHLAGEVTGHDTLSPARDLRPVAPAGLRGAGIARPRRGTGARSSAAHRVALFFLARGSSWPAKWNPTITCARCCTAPYPIHPSADCTPPVGYSRG
jgi:hypothetical protein